MIEIIVHLFLLAPLLVQVKNLKTSNVVRFLITFGILGVVSAYKMNMYLHQGKKLLFIDIERRESLYDMMGLSPKGFSSTELKKAYYSLSRQYHPDKNPAPEAAEKFRYVTIGNIFDDECF